MFERLNSEMSFAAFTVFIANGNASNAMLTDLIYLQDICSKVLPKKYNMFRIQKPIQFKMDYKEPDISIDLIKDLAKDVSQMFMDKEEEPNTHILAMDKFENDFATKILSPMGKVFAMIAILRGLGATTNLLSSFKQNQCWAGVNLGSSMHIIGHDGNIWTEEEGVHSDADFHYVLS